MKVGFIVYDYKLYLTLLKLDGLGGYQDFIEDENAGFGNWCERKFTKRVAVGTLFADEDELEHFASVSQGSWPGSSFVSLTIT